MCCSDGDLEQCQSGNKESLIIAGLPLDSTRLGGAGGFSLTARGRAAVISISSLALSKVSGVEGGSNTCTRHCPAKESLSTGLNGAAWGTEVNGKSSCWLGAKSFLWSSKAPPMVSLSEECVLCLPSYSTCGAPETWISARALLLAAMLGIFGAEGLSCQSPSLAPIHGPIPRRSTPSSGPGLGSQVLLDGAWLPSETVLNGSCPPFYFFLYTISLQTRRRQQFTLDIEFAPSKAT